jgi:hypothetical protein
VIIGGVILRGGRAHTHSFFMSRNRAETGSRTAAAARQLPALGKALAIAVVLAVSVMSVPAHAAGADRRRDKNDVKGILDIRNLRVGWTNTTLFLTITTYATWKPKVVGRRTPNGFIAYFTGPEKDVKEYYAVIFASNKKLVAPLFVKGQRSPIGEGTARKLGPKSFKVIIQRDVVEGLANTLFWAGTSFYKNRNKGCTKLCIDNSPKRLNAGRYWQTTID